MNSSLLSRKDSECSIVATQTGATWGIDRIDDRQGTDGSYEYIFDGTGVDIYVLDTGVVAHPDYNGRFKGCIDYTGEGCNVENPDRHGTHVGKGEKKIQVPIDSLFQFTHMACHCQLFSWYSCRNNLRCRKRLISI